jgi:hypothetical protein
MAGDINVTNSGELAAWNSQRTYIERPLEHSALIAAHPDTTLVLAGPPRLYSNDAIDRIFPIGMAQNIALTQRIPTTPMQALGSGRLFYVSGKAQVGATLQRLALKGKNLLRVMYSNAINFAGLDPSQLDDKASFDKNDQTVINLDSELFRIPFGLGVVFKDRLHHNITSFYMELCMISDWSMQVAVGQNMVIESISLMCDRITPYVFKNVGDNSQGYPSNDIYKAVFGNEAAAAQSADNP